MLPERALATKLLNLVFKKKENVAFSSEPTDIEISAIDYQFNHQTQYRRTIIVSCASRYGSHISNLY
jgi:hypothetical protein